MDALVDSTSSGATTIHALREQAVDAGSALSIRLERPPPLQLWQSLMDLSVMVPRACVMTTLLHHISTQLVAVATCWISVQVDALVDSTNSGAMTTHALREQAVAAGSVLSIRLKRQPQQLPMRLQSLRYLSVMVPRLCAMIIRLHRIIIQLVAVATCWISVQVDALLGSTNSGAMTIHVLRDLAVDAGTALNMSSRLRRQQRLQHQ